MGVRSAGQDELACISYYRLKTMALCSERGCVVLDQPQRLDRARRLRLVFDTAALR